MSQGASFAHPAFVKGCALFESGKLFEAHEEWETVWMAERGPVRPLLQALIQIAAAGVHLARGREAPAARLLALAGQKLRALPAGLRQPGLLTALEALPHSPSLAALRQLPIGSVGSAASEGRTPGPRLATHATMLASAVRSEEPNTPAPPTPSTESS